MIHPRPAASSHLIPKYDAPGNNIREQNNALFCWSVAITALTYNNAVS
jgi:hypothetical protein